MSGAWYSNSSSFGSTTDGGVSRCCVHASSGSTNVRLIVSKERLLSDMTCSSSVEWSAALRQLSSLSESMDCARCGNSERNDNDSNAEQFQSARERMLRQMRQRLAHVL